MTETLRGPNNARGRRKSHAARLTTLPRQPPAKRQDAARGAEVRDRVLQAAVECFGAFGFVGTSTRAVADRAEVSHPLLLYHFESKEQLWKSAMEALLGDYQSALDRRWQAVDPGDPAAAVRAFVENFVEFSAKVPELHRIMTQQSTQGSERIQWLIDRHLGASFKAVCGLIRKAQRSGRIRKGEPARLYYSVIGLGGTLFSVSNEYQLLAGKNVFSNSEQKKTIELVCSFLFCN